MPSQTVISELSKLEPSSVLELFELDASSVGLSPDPILRFHAGTNNVYSDIRFGGQSYIAFPIKMSGFEYDGKGSLPRPTLQISNINGMLSNYLKNYNNFLGCKFTRKKTFVRFIDNSNWPSNQNPYGSPSSELISEDDFYVFRKKNETKDYVEFELTTQMELSDVVIPNRVMLANICSAKQYRDGLVCPYAGIPVSDRNDKTFLANPFGGASYGLSSLTPASPLNWQASSYNSGTYVTVSSLANRNLGKEVYYVAIANTLPSDIPGVSTKWVADSCGRTIKACKLRFTGSYLPFGGFPGIARYPFS